MSFELHVLAADPALSLPTKMFLGCQMTSIDDLHTFHASDQTLTDGAGIAFRPFMLIVTPLALELSMAVFATSPGVFRTNGRKSATLAFVRAQVFFAIVVSLLTDVAVVCTGKESGHLGDDVIMVVVHVEVYPFIFLRTGVDDIIVVLFRDDIDLILGHVRLEQFGLFDPTRTERYVGILVKFLCHTRLHRSTAIRHTLVLWIVIELGFGDDKGSRHAQIVVISYSYDGSFLFQVFPQIHFRALAAFAPDRHTDVNHIDFHRVVQSKLLIGLNDLFKLGENVFRG